MGRAFYQMTVGGNRRGARCWVGLKCAGLTDHVWELRELLTA
jgi:hypothetical protein